MSTILPITKITNKLGSGIVKSNLYQIKIALNNTVNSSENFPEKTSFVNMMNQHTNIEDSIFLLCKDVELPGITMIPADDNTKFGMTRRYPQQFEIQPITLTFICSKSMEEKKFFEDWINFIYHRENTTEGNQFLSAYYDDYVATMYIDVLSDTPANISPRSHMSDFEYSGDDKILGRAIVYEAYPNNINSIRMSYEANDEYMSVGVSMWYRYYTFTNNV